MDPKAIRPKGRMCLLRKLDEGQRKSKGGILLPDTTKNPVDRAIVLAVGPGLVNEETGKRIATDVEPGETVLVPRYAGSEVTIDGEKLFLVPAPEVLAAVDESPAAPEPIGSGIGIMGGAR